MLKLISQLNSNMESSVLEGKEKLTVLNQVRPHDSRSDRYSFVGTKDIIEAFTEAGFTYKLIKQEKARKREYEGFGTHLISFEHPGLSLGNGLDKEMIPRLYFRNSYHGRTRLIINLGILRSVCMNGLMLGFSFESVNRKHIGFGKSEVKEIIEFMRKRFSDDISPAISSLKDTKMPWNEQMRFAELALKERLSSNQNFVKGEHQKLLSITREEDADDTYWNVLNRVQENLGLNFRPSPVDISYTYQATDEHNNVSYKERKIQNLSGIGNVTHLNRFLFDEIIRSLPVQNDMLKVAA